MKNIQTLSIVALIIAMTFASNSLSAQTTNLLNNQKWCTPIEGRHNIQARFNVQNGQQLLALKHNFPGFVQIAAQLLVKKVDGTTQLVPVSVKGIGEIAPIAIATIVDDAAQNPLTIQSMRITYTEFGTSYTLSYDGTENLCHLSREGRDCTYLGYFQPSAITGNKIPVESMQLVPQIASK